jgi:hypothetical protein
LRFLDLIDTTFPIRIIKALKLQSVLIAMSNSTTATTNPNGHWTPALTLVEVFAIGVPIVIVIIVLTVKTVFVLSYIFW